MTRPDSGAVDDAILAILNADAPLRALLPDGVYFDVAPPGSTGYAIIAIVAHADVAVFGRRAGEEYRLLVLSTTLDRSASRPAAERIDGLLEDAAIAIDGFTLDAIHRDDRVRDREVDVTDPALVWHHRGGEYRVVVALAA